MKRILHGIMMMAVFAAISAIAPSNVAFAETIKPSDISVDYVNQKLYITDTSYNSKVYVAKATVSVKKVKGTNSEVTTVKTAAPTEYDLVRTSGTGKATIDLSSYPVSKDTYLSIRGKWTDPLLVKLPATNTKMKAVVDAVTTTVTINDITDKLHPYPVTPVEYCTTNGVWTDYEAGKTDLSGYTALGAALRFRIKAQGNKQSLANTTEIGKDAEGKAITAYIAQSGNFASNELKVKIAKTANGPKATFDYVNHLIKIPNTCEYRIQSSGALGTFTAVGGTVKTVTLKADDLVSKGSEFDIRTVATDKKPASKITEYELMPIQNVAPQTSEGKSLSSISQDVTDSRIMDPYGSMTGGVENLADFKVIKLTGGSKSSAAMSMTVKNGTIDTYQFVVEDPQQVVAIGDLKLPSINAKVTGTVAAGKTATIKVQSGQYVYIRRAANARSQQWATPYAFFGAVYQTLE